MKYGELMTACPFCTVKFPHGVVQEAETGAVTVIVTLPTTQQSTPAQFASVGPGTLESFAVYVPAEAYV